MTIEAQLDKMRNENERLTIERDAALEELKRFKEALRQANDLTEKLIGESVTLLKKDVQPKLTVGELYGKKKRGESK